MCTWEALIDGEFEVDELTCMGRSCGRTRCPSAEHWRRWGWSRCRIHTRKRSAENREQLWIPKKNHLHEDEGRSMRQEYGAESSHCETNGKGEVAGGAGEAIEEKSGCHWTKEASQGSQCKGGRDVWGLHRYEVPEVQECWTSNWIGDPYGKEGEPKQKCATQGWPWVWRRLHSKRDCDPKRRVGVPCGEYKGQMGDSQLTRQDNGPMCRQLVKIVVVNQIVLQCLTIKNICNQKYKKKGKPNIIRF